MTPTLTTDEQLQETLATTAMTRAQEYALRDSLRRCVRCKRYDMEWKRCGSAKMVGGAYIEEPADYGCIFFDD